MFSSGKQSINKKKKKKEKGKKKDGLYTDKP